MTNKQIFVTSLLVLLALAALLYNKSKNTSLSQPNNNLSIINKDTPMDVSELKIEDTLVGTGREAKSGDMVVMHYTGTLLDGTKFDSSVDRGTPFETQIGVGQVIQGWDQGIPGMKIGGKRRLTIPSSLGYGSRGAGAAIPPNAGLIFDVELVNIK
jgi:FKBP-type peptidyl-prolyl cis-trans isomerase